MKWKLAGQAAILPSFRAIPDILSYRLLTGPGLGSLLGGWSSPNPTPGWIPPASHRQLMGWGWGIIGEFSASCRAVFRMQLHSSWAAIRVLTRAALRPQTITSLFSHLAATRSGAWQLCLPLRQQAAPPIPYLNDNETRLIQFSPSKKCTTLRPLQELGRVGVSGHLLSHQLSGGPYASF